MVDVKSESEHMNNWNETEQIGKLMKIMCEKDEDLSGELKFICEQWKWKC